MNRKGFSLLEVLIAVAILAIAFLTLINFQGQTMFRLSRAEKLTQATFLARHQMAETILQIEKEFIQQRVFPDEKSDRGDFDKPYENFKWEWNLRTVAIPTPEGEEGGMMGSMMRMVAGQIKEMVREVKLTVSWEELGKERKIDVTTHIGKL